MKHRINNYRSQLLLQVK